jgi:hypothetical protein
VRGDRALLLLKELAALEPGDDLSSGNQRRRRVVEPFRRVGHLDVPHHAAGARVERDDVRVGRVQEQLVLEDTQAADRANLGAGAQRLGKLAPVLPQQIAGGGVERLNRTPRVGEVHDAVVDNRARLLISTAHGPRPGEL